jgi:hypothetical protein
MVASEVEGRAEALRRIAACRTAQAEELEQARQAVGAASGRSSLARVRRPRSNRGSTAPLDGPEAVFGSLPARRPPAGRRSHVTGAGVPVACRCSRQNPAARPRQASPACRRAQGGPHDGVRCQPNPARRLRSARSCPSSPAGASGTRVSIRFAASTPASGACGGETRRRPSYALSWGSRRSDNLTIIRSPANARPARGPKAGHVLADCRRSDHTPHEHIGIDDHQHEAVISNARPGTCRRIVEDHTPHEHIGIDHQHETMI